MSRLTHIQTKTANSGIHNEVSGRNWNDPGYPAMLKSELFFCGLSLVGSAAAAHEQSSLGALKVTQQLQWTLMGHWGAVHHITGLLPLQSKRFQQSAGAAYLGGRTGKISLL